MTGQRQLRVRVLDALERRAKQFRSRDDVWPFRVPHEPLALDAVIDDALGGEGAVDERTLRARTVLRMEWDRGAVTWDAWAIVLPSGITLYCDSDGEETRILASVKRGNPVEADRFFLELLAESHGQAFGIEMSGGAPDRVRTVIDDRDFLIDFFVELLEGTDAGRSIAGPRTSDFRTDVDRWLSHVLVAPSPRPRPGRRRPRRLRDEAPEC